MNGKEIINQIVKDEMPNLEHVRLYCIEQGERKRKASARKSSRKWFGIAVACMAVCIVAIIGFNSNLSDNKNAISNNPVGGFEGFVLSTYAVDGDKESPIRLIQGEETNIGDFNTLKISEPGFPFIFALENGAFKLEISTSSGQFARYDSKDDSDNVEMLGSITVCENEETVFWIPESDYFGNPSKKPVEITVAAMDGSAEIAQQNISITFRDTSYYAALGGLETVMFKEIVPNYNPNNFVTAYDDTDVYFIKQEMLADESASYSLCKFPRKGGETELITPLNYANTLTMHNEYLYFCEDNSIKRILKSGGDVEIISSNNILGAITNITCYKDKIYLTILGESQTPSYLSYYVADIDGDPVELTFNETLGVPNANGVIYYQKLNELDSSELYSVAYLIAHDTETEEETVLVDRIINYTFFATDKYIFYADDESEGLASSSVEGLYRINLDGTNETKLLDTIDLISESYSIINYDDEFLYLRGWPTENAGYGEVIKIDMGSGEIFESQKVDAPYLDVVDGKLLFAE